MQMCEARPGGTGAGSVCVPEPKVQVLRGGGLYFSCFPLPYRAVAGTRDPIEIKILRTRVASADQLRAHARARHPPHATQQHHALHRSRQHPQSHHARTDACGTPAATVPPLPPGAAAQVVVTPAGELLVPCGDGSLLQILEVSLGAEAAHAVPGSLAALLGKRLLAQCVGR